MRALPFWAVLVCVLVSASAICTAQENEIAVTMGAYLPHHVHAASDDVFGIEGNVARRIFGIGKASLYVELPIAASLASKVQAFTIVNGQSFSTRDYSALFISPGLRLKLIPESRISPYFAFGGGLAHFRRTQSGGSSSTNTGVFDIGAGVDLRLARYVAFRGEIRDFYSGAPQLITGLPDREHQIFTTGGLVFRF